MIIWIDRTIALLTRCISHIKNNWNYLSDKQNKKRMEYSHYHTRLIRTLSENEYVGCARSDSLVLDA